MASDFMRVFVAVNPPPAIRDRLEVVQRRLKFPLARAGITWARPDQLHVTLKFLGDVPAEAIAGLQAALAACQDAAPFELSLAGLGVFPDQRKPRVIWAGLAGQLEALGRLQQRIEEATRPWSAPEARAFKPHLTLGRVRRISPAQVQVLGEKLEDLRSELSGGWRVGRVDLMRSVLTPDGAVYTNLGSHALA